MPAAKTLPPSPVNDGTKPASRGNLVIEQIIERVSFDVDTLVRINLWNGQWMLCYLPADQIGLNSPCWDQVKSAPGIYVARRSDDGKFYEVAVNLSCIGWFQSHKFRLDLYDPTKPEDSDVRVHGVYDATRRAAARFPQNAAKAIRSGPHGLESCYFQIAELHRLEVSLGWALLYYDIIESDQIRNKFTHCFFFLVLNLLQTYDTPLAAELLSKDQDDLLQVLVDLSKTGPRDATRIETQKISLVRCLLEFCGGRKDRQQHRSHNEYKPNEIVNLYGSLIGITGSHCFGTFDLQNMLDALSRSKVFTNDDIQALNLMELSAEMMTYLPIGFPRGYLNLPPQILHGLNLGEVNEIRVQIAQTYHQQPSLDIPENNILLLLTWSSIVNGQLPRVLSEWAFSDDGLSLNQRLMRDIQNSQTKEQLALTLAALLCHKRLLPQGPKDTVQPANGSYLADFDALINGEPLSNERVVFERMLFSFLRVLDTFIEDCQETRQFLATVLDTAPPLLESFDGFSDQYLVRRIGKRRLSHKDAFEMAHQCLVETTIEPSTYVGEGWMMLQSLKV